MTSSSPSHPQGQLTTAPETESPLASQLSSVVFDISHQVQLAMENMLKMINEINENSIDITEEIDKCRNNALERKNILEEQMECFQKAAYSVLDMLGNKDIR